jgi:DNA-binding NarL/FixJ family response regulator
LKQGTLESSIRCGSAAMMRRRSAVTCRELQFSAVTGVYVFGPGGEPMASKASNEIREIALVSSLGSTAQAVPKPTQRERELIALIGLGLKNKEIAYELNISENTVHAHIRNILRKYKLRNRTQIAIMFRGAA